MPWFSGKDRRTIALGAAVFVAIAALSVIATFVFSEKPVPKPTVAVYPPSPLDISDLKIPEQFGATVPLRWHPFVDTAGPFPEVIIEEYRTGVEDLAIESLSKVNDELIESFFATIR